MAAWALRELVRSPRSVLVLGVFVVSFVLSQLVACNVHELGHAAVGTVLGWEVETIRWCTPGGGSVTYSFVGIWAGNLQGYAGGLIAAGFLYVIYWRFLKRPERPLQNPVWWAFGAGLVFWIGPQLVIAVMEGSAGPGEDYTDVFEDGGWLFAAVLVSVGGLGLIGYFKQWNSVLAGVHVARGP